MIRNISENYVPVALNLYVIPDAKDAAGDFFRSVQRQHDHYQGIWIAAPDGKVLSSLKTDVPATTETWSKEVLATLDAGIKKFGHLARRQVQHVDPLPLRGCGCQADGTVTLAVTDKWVPDQGVEGVPNDPAHKGAGTFDSFTLTNAELATLAPAKATVGYTWTVPEATSRKLFPLLSTGDKVFRDAREVTAVHIAGKVDTVKNNVVYVSFEGEIAGRHVGTVNEGRKGQSLYSEAKLIGGVASYDTKASQLLALTLVFDGRFRNYPPYDNPPSRYAAVVDWRRR